MGTARELVAAVPAVAAVAAVAAAAVDDDVSARLALGDGLQEVGAPELVQPRLAAAASGSIPHAVVTGVAPWEAAVLSLLRTSVPVLGQGRRVQPRSWHRGDHQNSGGTPTLSGRTSPID